MAEDATSKPFPNMYEDNFGGVTIEIHDDEPLMGANDFHVRLRAHLSIFSQQEKAGIWLMLPLAVSHYVPAAVDLGILLADRRCTPCYVYSLCGFPIAFVTLHGRKHA